MELFLLQLLRLGNSKILVYCLPISNTATNQHYANSQNESGILKM